MSGAGYFIFLVVILCAFLLAGCSRENTECAKDPENGCQYPSACSCSRPQLPGRHIRYYYIPGTHTCQYFTGSEGGCNNFQTEQDCRSACRVR
uniref:Putative bpti/kunitz family of serine protease inhibitor n=1 Tax=Amblyomma tuberculatum TaxID=48802 RepID=A0A6M2E428_9ACAR